jgi:EmrB/QacA subfamily drug resistance transporter
MTAARAEPTFLTTRRSATADRRRWLVLAVMSIGTLLAFLDDTVVNTALPRISLALHASTSALQWVVDAYVLVLAGLLLLGGSIGDRYGRKRTMTVGLVLFGAAVIGASRSTTIGELIAMRAFQGVGGALVLPATLSIITNVFPREERAKAIVVWTAVGGLGVGLGPLMGGYLVDAGSWHTVFLLFVPLIVLALVGMLIVPESRDERGIGLDLPGAVLGTGGLSALLYGIIRGGEAGWGNQWSLVSFAAAAVLLVAFAVVEARSAAPMLPLQFFRQRDFTGAVLVIGITLFALFVTFFSLVQLFQLVQHRSALASGVLIIPVAVGATFATGIAGKLIHTLGPRGLELASATSMIIALVILSRTHASTGTLQFEVALSFIGIGAGLGLPALTDTVMAAVPERDAGVGSAVNDVSRQLGGALGVAVIGSIVSGDYRTKLHHLLHAKLPPGVVHAAGTSIGVAHQTARGLPAPLAATLTRAADDAFASAITRGFAVSAGVVGLAFVVAATMLPRHMRTAQFQVDADPGAEVPAELETASSGSTSTRPQRP